MSEYEKISVIFIVLTFTSFIVVSIVTIYLSKKTSSENSELQSGINNQNIAVQLYQHRYECYMNIVNIQGIMGYSITEGAKYDSFLLAMVNYTREIRKNLVATTNSAPLLFRLNDEEIHKLVYANELLTKFEKYTWENIDFFNKIDSSLPPISSPKEYVDLMGPFNNSKEILKTQNLEQQFAKEIEDIRQILYKKLYDENNILNKITGTDKSNKFIKKALNIIKKIKHGVNIILKKNIGIILGILILTIFLGLVDYVNIIALKHPNMDIEFWLSYFGILAAILFPLYLFNKEKNERIKNEEQTKKETDKKAKQLKQESDQKDSRNIFFSGISKIRPKLNISYQFTKYKGDTLLIENVGIGNATNIQFYLKNNEDNGAKYVQVLSSHNQYKVSEITIKPNREKIIDVLFPYNSDTFSSDNIVNFENLVILYTNLLGSEIYISEYKIGINKEIEHNYFSSYNFREPEMCEKLELLEIIQNYVDNCSLEDSIYKYQDFIKKLEE